MTILTRIWHYCVDHPIDVALALVFGIIFAILADFLQPASRIRAGIRRFKNYMVEGSDATLRERISTNEQYRNQMVTFLESDKAHYLAALKYILGVALLICAGATALTVGFLMGTPGQYALIALAPFMMGIVLGVLGIRIASWDSRPKISEAIEQLDKELAALRAKLKLRKE